MSYILDALRKSEQQRHRGQLPGISGGPEAPPPRRRRGWIWLLVLVLLLNAGWFAGWLLIRDTEPTVEAERPVATPEQVAQTVVRRAVVPAGHGPVIPAPRAQAVRPEQGPKELSKLDAVDHGLVAPVPSSDLVAGPASISAPQAEVTPVVPAPLSSPAEMPKAQAPSAPVSESPAAEAERAVYRLHDLPAGEKQPNFTLSLHFFSTTPGARMVRLNGQLLHEGDPVEEGWRVKEISPTGVLLRGERFDLQLERP